MGPGSLHDTLTHVVGAMFRWADRIDGPTRALRPSIEDGSWRTPAELMALLEQAATDLSASVERARACGLETELDVTLGGQAYRFTLGAMLVHVTTHGMHHRAVPQHAAAPERARHQRSAAGDRRAGVGGQQLSRVTRSR